MSEPSSTRWRLLGAGVLAAAAIVLCGGLVAIATGGTDSGDGVSTPNSEPFAGAFTGADTDGLTGGITGGLTDGFLTGSTPIEGGSGGGGAARRPISALWTGVGIGAIVALLGGCAVLLRRSRPSEATDEGPDFWSDDEPSPPAPPA